MTPKYGNTLNNVAKKIEVEHFNPFDSDCYDEAYEYLEDLSLGRNAATEAICDAVRYSKEHEFSTLFFQSTNRMFDDSDALILAFYLNRLDVREFCVNYRYLERRLFKHLLPMGWRVAGIRECFGVYKNGNELNSYTEEGVLFTREESERSAR